VYFVMTIVMVLLTFLVQLVLCLSAKKRWVRILPVILVSVLDLIGWGLYALAVTEAFGEIYSIEMGFTGFIFGIMGLYLVGGAVAAWGVFAVVKFIQKRRK